MNLLLISNSTMAGEPYLHWPLQHLADFFNRHQVKEVCFIPYAGVHLHDGGLQASYDVYTQRVAGVFQSFGVKVTGIHNENDPEKAIRSAEAVVVGGGNTFYLVAEMYRNGIMNVLREKVKAGMPYAGWSAGANVACPTLKTTNDMPIVEPESFQTLGLIPFQINPHYLDAHPDGHGGETREQRIEEFLAVNQDTTVVGLREGCLLLFENDTLHLKGNKSMRIFRHNTAPREVDPGSDLSFLL